MTNPTNEYDALAMAPTEAAKPVNEYDAVVVDFDRERNQRVRGALVGAEGANPDAAAKAVTLSRATGLPADMVERNLPAVEGEHKINEYDTLLKAAPKVGSWLLADPMNAKVVGDDYASLGLLEKLWNEVKRGGYGISAGSNLLGAAATMSVAERTEKEIADARDRQARGEYLSPWDKARIANADAAMGNVRQATADSFSNYFGARTKEAALPIRPALKELNEAPDLDASLTAIGKDPLGLIFDLTAQSLPQLGIGIAAAVAGGPLAGVGAGYLTSFGSEFVTGILDQLQSAGVDVNDQAALQAALSNPDTMREVYRKSATKAGVIAAVDALSMGIAGKTLAPAKLAARPVMREATNLVAQSLVQAAAGGGGEALGSIAIGEDVKANAVLSEVLGGLGTMPAEVVTMRQAAKEAAGLAKRTAEVAALPEQATATLGALDALVDEAGKSGLAQRSPEKFAEFMQSLSDSDETVYVPAAAMTEYLQSLDQTVAAQMADRFEITDQLPEAVARGGDVLIPLAKYVTNAGEGAHVALREHVRTTPDGMSFIEARDTQQERMAQLEQDAVTWREKLEDGDEAATPGQQVYNDVFNQSRAAGYTIDAAQQHAALYASRYQSRAERTGGDAWEAYQRSKLTIQQVLPDNIRYAEPDQIDVLLNSIRSGKEPPMPKGEAPTLLEWLGRRGGALDVGGELKARDLGRWHLGEKGKPIKGRSPLIADTGKEGQGAMFGLGDGPKRGLDDTALAAWETGFFPEHAERPSIDDFLAAVDEETRGRPRRSEDAPHDPRADFRQARADLDEALNRLGLDVAKLRNREIKKALKAIEEGDAEGGQVFDQDARGSIRFQDGKSIISLFRARNLSTFLHETGHLWLEEMRADAMALGASDQVKADFEAIKDAIGARGKDIERHHHEQFARSIETYLMEGQAPSEGLRAAFRSFKNWLVSIYRNLASLNAPISDDMRAIFDRLVAVDDEIAAAREKQGLNPIFKDAASAGMTEAEFAAYTAAARKALDQSEDQAINKAMADVRQRRTKEWKEEAKAVRADVQREVMLEPGQAALHLLRTGKLWDGKTPEALAGVKLDRAELLELYGDEAALAMLPAGLYREKGAQLDTLAEAMGFVSGRAMVDRLMGIEQQRRDLRAQGDTRPVVRYLVETETERRMTERHGDALKDGSIEADALELVRNDRMGLVMSTELKALARINGGTLPATWADIKAWAVDTMSAKSVKEATQVGRYVKAERDAGKAVQRLLLAGDTVAAFKAKQEQMLNSALAMEAKRIAGERDSAVKMLDRYASAKTIKSMDQSHLEQIHGLLERYDFKKATEAELNRRADFAEWAIQQQADGVDIVAPAKLLQKSVLTHYGDMTVEEMRGLSDAVKQIAHLGMLKKKLVVKGEKVEFDALADEFVSTVEGLRQLPISDARNPGKAGLGLPDKVEQWAVRFKSGARLLDGGLLRIETAGDWLDNYNSNGVFNSVVMRPLSDAEALRAKMQKEKGSQFAKLKAALPKEASREYNTRHEIPELIDSKTGRPSRMLKSEVISMALNMGNASNKDKLLRGEKWEEADVKAVLDRFLTKADWDYVQGIWDTINTLWPQVEAMYKAINGVPPPKVEAVPVETPHGTYRGGYYPVKYDPARSADAADRAAKNANSLFETFFQRAQTSNGFSNERIEGHAAPLDLNLEVLPRHINEVIHDIAFREPIRQADKFLSDKRVRSAIEDALGPEVYAEFRPWLVNIANEYAVDPRAARFWENGARYARMSASLVGMGLRATTVFNQVTGLFDAAEAIGPKWVAKGMASFAGDPLRMAQTRDFVFEKSGMMANRMGNTERDVRDGLRELIGQTSFISEVRRFAYYGVGIMDMGVSLPTWMGAYKKALHEGMADGDAVYAADKAVRNSQGAGGAKDLSRVMRGSEVQKLFTMFYSYFSHFYNRQRDIVRSARDAKSAGDVAMVVARSFFLMVPGAIVGALLSGQGPKEDEDKLLWALRKIGFGLFAGIPVVRDVASGAERTMGGNFGTYQVTPAARAVDVISRTLGDAAKAVGLKEGEVGDDWIKHALETSGYVFGLPTGQIGSTTQFLWDVSTGRQEPDDISDWFKGVIYGKFEDRK